MECMYLGNGINLSKHAPVVMIISDGLDQLIDKTVHRAPISVQKVAWHKVNDAHVAQYNQCLDNKLNDIKLPNEALVCKSVLCVNFNHKCMLHKLCKDLIMSCIDVSNEVLPQTRLKNHTLPYWNDLVEHFNEKSLFWHCIWIEGGKPHEGAVAQVMRTARARYHKTVKDILKNEDELCIKRMAEAISDNNQCHLWNEIDKVTPSSILVSSTIDSADSNEEIAEILADKFESLYQSIPTDSQNWQY